MVDIDGPFTQKHKIPLSKHYFKENVKNFRYVICSLSYIFLTGIKQLLQCKNNNWLQHQSQWNQWCSVQSMCWENICIRVKYRADNWLKYVFNSCETNCFIKLLAYWRPFFSICGALSSQSMLIMALSQFLSFKVIPLWHFPSDLSSITAVSQTSKWGLSAISSSTSISKVDFFFPTCA